MLEILRMIEKRGALEKMRKVRQFCNQIFRYAIATGRATVNPAAELTGTLQAPENKTLPPPNGSRASRAFTEAF